MRIDPTDKSYGQDPTSNPDEPRHRPEPPPRKWYDRGERFYVVLWLIFAALIAAILIKRGGL
jgi:hypothetical protein